MSNIQNTLYIFTGAGNNFVVLDGRGRNMQEYRNPSRITELCRAHHTDGLMILDTRPLCPADAPLYHSDAPLCHSERSRGISFDFSMEFYNPDGPPALNTASSPPTAFMLQPYCPLSFRAKSRNLSGQCASK